MQLTVIFITIYINLRGVTGLAICPVSNSYTINGICYYLMYGQLTWNDAQTSCWNQQKNFTSSSSTVGQLASFVSSDDGKSVVQTLFPTIIAAQTNDNTGIWIGMNMLNCTTLDWSCLYWVNINSSQKTKVSTNSNDEIRQGIGFDTTQNNNKCVFFNNNNFILEECDKCNSNVYAYLCQTGFDGIDIPPSTVKTSMQTSTKRTMMNLTSKPSTKKFEFTTMESSAKLSTNKFDVIFSSRQITQPRYKSSTRVTIEKLTSNQGTAKLFSKLTNAPMLYDIYNFEQTNSTKNIEGKTTIEPLRWENFEQQLLTTSVYMEQEQETSMVIQWSKTKKNMEELTTCEYGNWADYTACSATCGSLSIKHRMRNVTKGSNSNCSLGSIETFKCNVPFCVMKFNENPMSPVEQKIATVLQAFGCTWILGLVSVSFALSVAFWSTKVLQVLHVSQDLSLILAHSIIAYARNKTDEVTLCAWTAIGLQYFFLVNYTCSMFETLHVLIVITNITMEGCFNLSSTLLIVWGLPLLPVGLTAVTYYQHYISNFSCWINFGSNVALLTILPILLLTSSAFVILETAGQYNFRNIQFLSTTDVIAAKISQRGLLFILPLNTAALLFGALAIYEQNIGLFTTVFGLNVALGSTVAFFHVTSNGKGIKFVRNLWKRFCSNNHT